MNKIIEIIAEKKIFKMMYKYLIALVICIIFVASYATDTNGKIEPGDIEDTVTNPIRDGVSLTIPPGLANNLKASYGYVDATLKMFGADPTGRRDSTAALNHALKYARKNQMVVYLPSGNYKVTDTVDCAQDFYRRSTGAVQQARLYPCVLVGERSGSRPKIILQKNSKGFDDQKNPKPVIHFWSRAGLYKPGSTRVQHDGAVSMNQMLINVDVEVEEGNRGAIGVALYGAQGTGIEESRIDVRHGYIGIQGGSGSGGSVIDVEVIGGKYGLDYRQAQPVPLVVGARLYKQTGAAILYRGRQTLVLVGCEIESASGKPVIVGPEKIMQPHWGQISIVDSAIVFGNPNGSVIDSRSSFTMNNVFIKGSRKISSSGLQLNKMLDDTKWVQLKQVAYGINPKPLHGYKYTMPIYVDHKQRNSPFIVASEYDKNPLLLIRKHLFQRRLPDFQSKQVVNVKAQPFSAKGDGVTDDTVAIQRAVLSGKNIFFPKGYYNITRTIEVPSGVNLFGVARHLSIITSTGFISKKNAPLLRVNSGGDKGNMLAFMGLMPPKELPYLYALDWQASAASVVRDVNFFSHYLKGYSSPQISKSKDRIIPLVKISGAGQWYNFFQEEPRKQGSSYRHIKVDGSTEGLVFYGLDLEHSRGDCNGEIIHSSNIIIYGLKGEGNHTILCVSDSKNISVFGFGGNASAFPGQALLKFNNVSKYILTNLVTHHRPVGQGSIQSSYGLMYDPKTWDVFQESSGGRVTWRPGQLERPVLISRGIKY